MRLNQIKKTAAQFSRFRQSLSNTSILAFALLLPMLFAASCAKSSSDIADIKGGVTAQQIIENPSAYVGKTVTVSGDVEEIWGPRAFNMDSGSSVGELLIVGREPFPQIPGSESRAYVINDVATVTGVLRIFNTADIEKEIGWNLDPNIVNTFNGKPVLVVSKAEFRPGKGGTASTTGADKSAMTDANNSSAMMDANNSSSMTGGDVKTMSDNKGSGMTMTDKNGKPATISDNNNDIVIYETAPDKTAFANKKADYTNARVVRVVGPRTFTIASDKGKTEADEIYVMLDDASARGVGTQGKINVGDKVNVSGTFEPLQMDEIKDIEKGNFVDLTNTEREFLKKTKIYLQANKVVVSK